MPCIFPGSRGGQGYAIGECDESPKFSNAALPFLQSRACTRNAGLIAPRIGAVYIQHIDSTGVVRSDRRIRGRRDAKAQLFDFIKILSEQKNQSRPATGADINALTRPNRNQNGAIQFLSFHHS